MTAASEPQTAPPQTPPPAIQPGHRRRAMTGLMLVLTLASLDGNIVGPALPRIVSDLGGLAHLSWVVTAFAVASTASTPLYGKLSDQFGRRPAFFLSIVLFLLGSALCGAAHGMAGLIASRALQGVGAGGLITLVQTAVADLVSPRERGSYQGMVAGVFALCSVAGPLLGGIITDAASWRWIFYLNLPIGGLALAILAAFLPHRPPRPPGSIDAAGFALLIGATCAFMLLLSWGGTVYAWTSVPVLGLAAATLLMLGLLIPTERRAPEPALPPRLFANRVFVCGTTAISLLSAALFGSLVFIPLFFQIVLGASATEAGLRMAPLMAGLIVSSFASGRLVTRTGRYKRFIVAGLAVGTAGFAAMAAAAGAGASADLFNGLLVVLGLGLGLVMPNVTTAVQSAVPAHDVGVATSTLGFFRSLGGAFGITVAGTILAANLRGTAGFKPNLGLAELQALPAGARAILIATYGTALGWIFAAAAVIAAAAFLAVLFMPERELRGAKG